MNRNSMDTNTAKLKKYAFRVTKERGLTASRVRVPGGHLEANYLGVLQRIAENYGNGTVHITSRQGFEIPGIPFDKMDKVNAELQSIIEGLEINQEMENEGYPAAGTRNITTCIGNRVCPYAYNDTLSCVQWCRYARKCVGDEMYEVMMKIAATQKARK